MGAGLKTFADNELLTAEDVNGYLMRQSVIVVPNVTIRDAIADPDHGMCVYVESTGILYIRIENPRVSVTGWFPAAGLLPLLEADASAAKAIPNSTWTVLDSIWGTPLINRGFTSFSSGQVTIEQAGIYQVDLQVSFSTMSGTDPRVGVQATRNSPDADTFVILKNTVSSQNGGESHRRTFLAAGDVVRFFVIQTSGSSQNTLPNVETHVGITYISAV